VTSAGIATQRLHNQRLVGPRAESAEEIVSLLGAVQAQDFGAAKWGVAQRTEGVTDSEFDRLFGDGAILRTHVMRPTWHFVVPGDIRWMLELTAPRVNAANAYYHRRLELDGSTFQRAGIVLKEALSAVCSSRARSWPKPWRTTPGGQA
jgi:winged helix DNA-binding protein